ncbi:hypothetical protein QBC41DRAFT_307032 [Cercophora samala]|uniref:Uncharacterized protein n=1 Tax=Cercophora samala TaxID=330535 RepID=A0AA40D6R0_9PEZI|nr:hypothetical protein QBC41DRAFT_307032 [Cercophora samala]
MENKDLDNQKRQQAILNFTKQCLVCPVLNLNQGPETPLCPRCATINVFVRKDEHMTEVLCGLEKISEVFNWEEFITTLNNVIVNRVAETLKITPDKDEDHVYLFSRSWTGVRTPSQESMYAKSLPRTLLGDLQKVYEQAMLRRAVFRLVGCGIATYDLIGGGTAYI